MDDGNSLPSEHGLRDCAGCSNRAVPAFYGDAIRHCSPQTTFIWPSADFVEIGGGLLSGELVSASRPRVWLTKPVIKAGRLLMDGRGGGSFFDELGRFLGMRDVGRVAGIDFNCLRIGALGHHALLLWID